jgi:hypothetical protein
MKRLLGCALDWLDALRALRSQACTIEAGVEHATAAAVPHGSIRLRSRKREFFRSRVEVRCSA